MYNTNRSRSNARGFSLIEALIALLVLSFGMLAIAGFQVTLSRSSDLAKQRSEAVRLAQQKMESLRAYGRVDPPPIGSPAVVNYTNDVVSGPPVGFPDVTTTNADFTRTWTVTANATNTEKWINVQVAWTDRTGQAQTVQLLSVISKFDPQDVGTLATGPGTSAVRKPKNRNINIPYPAITLSGGTQSAFIPPPGGIAYVFDNSTGNIVQSCTGLSVSASTPAAISSLSFDGITNTVTVNASGHSLIVGYTVAIAGTSDSGFNGQFTVVSATAGSSFTYTLPSSPGGASATGGTATRVGGQLLEGLDLASSGASCSGPLLAYLLSGYVRFDSGNSPSGAEPNNPTLSRHDTLPLLASGPLALDVSNRPTPSTGGDPSMVCYAQRQKVVSTTSTAPVTITNVSRSGSTVTVSAPGHAFVVGQTVAINGTTDPAFIGAFVIDSVTAGSSFTYTLPPPLPTGSTGATGGTAALLERLTIAEGVSLSGPFSVYTNVVSRFVSYACVVTPVDHDGVATPKRWWGSVTLVPNSSSSDGTVWSISTGQRKVCRYSADFNGNAKISNSEHPLWYRGVTGALDSQNFLVISDGQSCPTDKAANPLGSPATYADNTTANHQPTGELSFQCANAACAGANKAELEPLATDTTELLMD